MDKLIEIISYFAIMSVAAERLTDMIKRSWLSKINPNPVVYQVISGSFGAALSYTAPITIPGVPMPVWSTVIITGLAVSGGSGLWNTVLSTLSELKTKVALNNATVK